MLIIKRPLANSDIKCNHISMRKYDKSVTDHGFIVAPGKIGTKDNGQVGRSHLIHVAPASIPTFYLPALDDPTYRQKFVGELQNISF